MDNSKNENDECEKKRKAEERRRQILESFALQRKNFAEKNKEILGNFSVLLKISERR